MNVPTQRLAADAQKAAAEYLDIPLKVGSVLKGGDVRSAIVRVYPKDSPSKPSNRSLVALSGAPAILFLTRVEEGPTGLYFAGSTPESLKAATRQAIGATRAEVARQTRVVRFYQVNPRLARFSEVSALIARLGRVDGDEPQRVFDQLEALGKDAVPAIIAQMDDRRPLRTQAIALVNHSADAFEGVRHYGPKQVVDGLAAVLTQMTGASFGSIENGGSDRQREAAVAAWRVYASDLACKTRR